MIDLRKFLARRVRLRITRPVLIGDEALARGAVVEVSREQELALRATACAVPADDFTTGHLYVIPRGAVVRQLEPREGWRPRRSRNRLAQKGCARLDPGAGILEQVREFVGR